MGRISNLIDQVADDSTNLGSVLRQARVLAYELKVQELGLWAEKEINGYHEADQLPEYRRATARNFGSYLDPVRQAKRLLLPMHVLPDDMRNYYNQLSLYQGVGALEEVLRSAEGEGARLVWPSEHLALLNHHFQQNVGMGGAGFTAAWTDIPRSVLTGVLENVRNRLLGFLLALREESPDLDVPRPQPTPGQQEEARQLFRTEIHGTYINVAQGHAVTQSVDMKVNTVDDLIERIKELGVDIDDAERLREAIHKDTQSGEAPKGGFGAHVRQWLGDFSANAAGSALASQLPAILEGIRAASGG